MEGLRPGRIIDYVLTQSEAETINRRRRFTSPTDIRFRISNGEWPLGAQAHVGNSASAGQHMAGVVVAVWLDEFGQGDPGINAQIFLDGNDTLWVTSRRYDETDKEPGTWHWPERA